MVLPLISQLSLTPNILRHQDRGGAELHLIELPFKREESSANFALTAFYEVGFEVRLVASCLLWRGRSRCS